MTEFKIGDVVRKQTGLNFSNSGSATAKVVKIVPGGVYVDKNKCRYHPSRLELVSRNEKVGKQPIVSIKVREVDINKVLTDYVRNELGIDASVTRITAAFNKALELELSAA